MNTPAKLGGFALAAVLAFGGAYGIGQATGPVGAVAGTAHGDQHGPAAAPASGELPAGGLMVAQDGYRLDLISGHAAAGAGAYTPAALPAPSRTATVDGYTVRLDGDLVPGQTNELTLTLSKAGRPVTDLQPYLAAYGHLVVLRERRPRLLTRSPGR